MSHLHQLAQFGALVPAEVEEGKVGEAFRQLVIDRHEGLAGPAEGGSLPSACTIDCVHAIMPCNLFTVRYGTPCHIT